MAKKIRFSPRRNAYSSAIGRPERTQSPRRLTHIRKRGLCFVSDQQIRPGAHYSASATIVPFFFVAALTITIATAETRMPINAKFREVFMICATAQPTRPNTMPATMPGVVMKCLLRRP